MKHIVNISLGSSLDDYEFETPFLGHQFKIKRFGTDGSLEKAAELLLKWNRHADAIGLGSIKSPYGIGASGRVSRRTANLHQLSREMDTPVTTGDAMRKVGHEWSLRHVQHYFGDNYFNNQRVLFLSGMSNYVMAKVMSEYTGNLTFADPILENGIPKFLNSMEDLELYATGVHSLLQWIPGKKLTSSTVPLKTWGDYIVRKAMQKAFIIVVPYYNFYQHLESCTLEELGGKIVLTSTAYEDRIQFLKERGVDVIIDSTPRILKKVVGFSALEAMVIAALERRPDEVTTDDFLEIISEQRMDPRVIYPSGQPRRVNRFAFVINPLSREFLKRNKYIDLVSRVAPQPALDTLERLMAYMQPFVYSKVTGIKSPLGVEAEGWLIGIGGTPQQMISRSPDFTYKLLLQASRMAKRLGAQIMGLGAFTKVVGDAGTTVAKMADIPITTGNSYSASGALWAAADAARRMGLLEIRKGKTIQGKAMVVGATGSIGSVCCRLLAKAFEEVYLVDDRDARLLALKESIEEESPGVKVAISTRADKFLPDMDVIVIATSREGKPGIDIARVKPGCIITDVARPLDLSPEEVAKRPDVLVIESGEIELPGNPEMKDIGLPPKVAYACLAETIVLALEGRYENFTIGRNIEWTKVREIYRMGLKHGMRLAAISGHRGVFSDQDIARVRDLALKARQGGGGPRVMNN